MIVPVSTGAHPEAVHLVARNFLKRAHRMKELCQVKRPNQKFFVLLKILYLNKIYLILSFPHRVLLACPAVLCQKTKQSQSFLSLQFEQKCKLEEMFLELIQKQHFTWYCKKKAHRSQNSVAAGLTRLNNTHKLCTLQYHSSRQSYIGCDIPNWIFIENNLLFIQ